MNMKVILWDSMISRNIIEKEVVEKAQQQYSFFKNSKQLSDLDDAALILIHDAIDNQCKQNKWAIEYSGSSQIKLTINSKSGIITANKLFANLNKFLAKINDKEFIEDIDIYTLYDYDPILEYKLIIWRGLSDRYTNNTKDLSITIKAINDTLNTDIEEIKRCLPEWNMFVINSKEYVNEVDIGNAIDNLYKELFNK